jgi:nicotinate-nucleotide pyrophosphorylase (carboxylating)
MSGSIHGKIDPMLTNSIKNSVQQALAEDIGLGDITAELLPNMLIKATILCRETAVLCGQDWVNETFKQLDPKIDIQWLFQDGDDIAPNSIICEIKGPVRPILTGERTALNFLQTLSGTATITRRWAQLIAHTAGQLLDTRKTLPGLRLAQKYAVKIGGGVNHRLGLYDAYLIKENHIAAMGGITPAIEQARLNHPQIFIEVEVETLDEFKEAVLAQPDRIMLDNFDLKTIQIALALPHDAIQIEVSGGVDEKVLRILAEMGVDCISVGALTKHVQAVDFSMIVL